jgi:hypothetical protein
MTFRLLNNLLLEQITQGMRLRLLNFVCIILTVVSSTPFGRCITTLWKRNFYSFIVKGNFNLYEFSVTSIVYLVMFLLIFFSIIEESAKSFTRKTEGKE